MLKPDLAGVPLTVTGLILRWGNRLMMNFFRRARSRLNPHWIMIPFIVSGVVAAFAQVVLPGQPTGRKSGQPDGNQAAPANPAPRPRIWASERAASLEETVGGLMRDGEVPGLSLAIVEDSQIVYSRGFGIKNAITKEVVDRDTIFEAASLSKPVFAYAVLRLANAGKLDLDTPLVKYLPGPYVDGDNRLDSITARMVLDHTTGFPNWRPIGQPLKIYFDPGSRFSYSGEGFVYLQKVVEHITGKNLAAVMKDTVLDPLGMTSSSYVWQDVYDSRIAVGHSQAGITRPVRKPTEPNAASSLHTTAGDYARFVAALLNPAPLREAGLKPETWRQMLTPQIKVNQGCVNCTFAITGKPSEQVSWGLGIGLQQTGLGPAFWHWGDNNSEYNCFVVGFIEKKAGIVVFTNSGNGLSIIPDIVAAAFGITLPAFDWLHYDRYNSPAPALFHFILAQGAGTALARYREARISAPRPEELSEAQMNSVGSWLLQRGKASDALEVFRQNIADHPQSANAYNSLGEAYVKLGDKEQAIKSYQKSLELNPGNGNAVQALKTLGAK
jgi:CubicO group peptidase (beta-lactamase class C family)